MTRVRVFITAAGIISPVGWGISPTIDAISQNLVGIKPLTIFPAADNKALKVGEIRGPLKLADYVPRTHALALMATQEALKDSKETPDAIVMGVTTGGIATTEELLKKRNYDPALYKYHAAGSVAEHISKHLQCQGLAITVSTACSSGAAAIKIGLELLRCGLAKRVLAGGADSLCRLTYYGFKSLQLIDPSGAHPLDKNRKGMSVGEGAAVLLLTAAEEAPANAMAEVLGGGLSCDAYHPTAPHPDGTGALTAMRLALSDGDLPASSIDYINLHGTGTIDNDTSEAKALIALFGGNTPPLSSIKGAFGHSLGASGAIEAVVSAISICYGIIPANSGCQHPDPELRLHPVMTPFKAEVKAVLSNSFGFGGNNASLVFGHPEESRNGVPLRRATRFAVLGTACITGAGDIEKTLANLSSGKACKGVLTLEEVSGSLPARDVRRFRRLPRMVLSLAISAYKTSGLSKPPSSVFFGTGWGALSETYDFLTKLFESEERFTSPTDFIGSVHNAAAGQVAIRFKSTGKNITTTGGDYSFEQALLSASVLVHNNEEPLLLIGADEYHKTLSRLFDPSVAADEIPSDGGAALCLKPGALATDLRVSPVFFNSCHHHINSEEVIKSLIKTLGGRERINELFGAVLVGIPALYGKIAEKQLDDFLSLSGFEGPVISTMLNYVFGFICPGKGRLKIAQRFIAG